jgi:hypothetical protein
MTGEKGLDVALPLFSRGHLFADSGHVRTRVLELIILAASQGAHALTL